MTLELAPSTSFNDVYASRLAVVEAGVESFCDQLCEADADPVTSEARKAFVTQLKGPAKRIRGVLTDTGYQLGRELYPNKDVPADDAIIAQAAGITEAIHAYILVLDDMADRASRRRNLPTVHAHLGEFMSPERARDYAETISFIVRERTEKTLLRLGLSLPAENLIVASYILHNGLELTGYGQGRDMLPASQGSGLGHALQVAIDKTAHYTFGLPLQVGAALAGAPPLSLHDFTGYAFNAGLAFQFQDDIISTFGDPKKTGKDAMSDIREGKETILIALARERASDHDLEVLQRALGNAALDELTFRRCLEVIKSTGALQETHDLVNKLTRQAIDSLPESWPARHVQFLRDLAIAGSLRQK